MMTKIIIGVKTPAMRPVISEHSFPSHLVVFEVCRKEQAEGHHTKRQFL